MRHDKKLAHIEVKMDSHIKCHRGSTNISSIAHDNIIGIRHNIKYPINLITESVAKKIKNFGILGDVCGLGIAAVVDILKYFFKAQSNST